MKTKILFLIIATVFVLLMNFTVVTAQVQFGEEESFAFTVYVDPAASLKEHGLDIGADIEYRGAVYAKAGIESFADLPGGYFDIHGGFGPRITIGRLEQLAVYAGGRAGFVYRNGATNPMAGFEGGVDYVFNGGLLIGINASYIYRGDMKAMQWPEIWRENVYVRIGYTWN